MPLALAALVLLVVVVGTWIYLKSAHKKTIEEYAQEAQREGLGCTTDAMAIDD